VAARGQGSGGGTGALAARCGDCVHVGAEEDVNPTGPNVRSGASRDSRVVRGGATPAARGRAGGPAREGRTRTDPGGLFLSCRRRRAKAALRVRSEAVLVPESRVGHAGPSGDRV